LKQSTIEGYTNVKSLYNTPSFIAQALAQRISKWSVHNIALGFAPPTISSVAVIAQEFPPPDEALEPELFEPGKLLYDRPLNFYIAINAKPEPFLINAGYLGAHFIYSARQGYKELKRLLSDAVPAGSAPQAEEVSHF